jgi:UDP:flavonoid glycosyltransferase YjiC (YdhE family)
VAWGEMRVLLAWELGENYGHLSKLISIAGHLHLRGHQVLFVVKNIGAAQQLLDDKGFRYIQSPRSTVRKNRFRLPASFADILSRAGFGSFDVLDGLLLCWREIFNNIQPDVVVAQYAPVAQFAARLSDLPCLSLHTGFECPPLVTPFPCFRPNTRMTRNQLLARELEILHNINRICSRQRHYCCPNLQEFLRSDINLLTTLPEFDHYQHRQNKQYIGPISMLDYGETVRWSERNVPRIFVYLRSFPNIGGVLDVLANSGADVIAHIPNIGNRISANYTSSSVRITSSMIKLSGLLADMDLAITHAGHGTACTILLAGVPLLMIPTTIEQWLMNRNVEHLGVGIGVTKKSSREAFKDAMERLLADHSYRERAQKLARKYAAYDQERVITRIANTIERLPAWLAGRKRDFHGHG